MLFIPIRPYTALDHSRGNIFHSPYGITWNGPTYCGTEAQAKNDAAKELRGTVEQLTEF